MATIAVIPTKIETHLFNDIIDTLDVSQVDEVYIFNNAENRSFKRSWMRIEDARNLSIYQMWNRGLDIGDQFNASTLILNDDIQFKPHMVSILAAYLDRDKTLGIVFPDYEAAEDTGEYSLRYTDTTAGAGGMSGYCFMIRPNLRIRVDENLRLYWGDDDLVKQVIAKGYKIARVVGLPVLHAGSYTINRMAASERQRLMESDLAYFNRKYQESRAPV